jgi:DNA polymerase-3 subunit beta
MKFSTPTKPLLSALELASNAIPSRTTLPVLTCAKFDVSRDSVTVICDSLDSRVSVHVPGIESDSEFSFLAPPRLFKAALRGESAEIAFDGKTKRLKIESGGVTSLSTLPVDEFPPDWKTPKTHAVNLADFLKALKITAAAASQDEARPAICGVVWNPAMKEMSATDGNMLTVVPIEIGLKATMVIPNGQARLISACFAVGEGLEIGELEHKLYFESGDVRAWVRLFEGNAINYRAVIPNNDKPIASVPREALLSALASLEAFAEGANFHKVLVVPGKEWRVEAGNGDNETSVPIDGLTAIGKAPESFLVNRSNLMKLLRHWTADRVTVGMNDALITLKPEDESGCLGLSMQFKK